MFIGFPFHIMKLACHNSSSSTAFTGISRIWLSALSAATAASNLHGSGSDPLRSTRKIPCQAYEQRKGAEGSVACNTSLCSTVGLEQLCGESKDRQHDSHELCQQD